MADKNETSPSPAPTPAPAPPAVANSADLKIDTSMFDEALKEAAPDFLKGLSDIGPGISATGVLDDAVLDPDSIALDDDSYDPQQHSLLDRWKRKARQAKRRLKQRFQIFKTQFVLFITETLPELGKQLLHGLKTFLGWIRAGIASFGSLSKRQKLILMAIIGVTGAGVGVVYKSFRSGILPEADQILIPQLDVFSQQTIYIKATDGYDWFYDSPRASQNLVSMKRMVFNIKASRNSGPQPMAAVELFIEGYAPDVIIEIKDREPELLDLFQREGEQMSYDQLSSGEGKRLLSEKLQNVINQVLTEGKVKKIYLKNFILKP